MSGSLGYRTKILTDQSDGTNLSVAQSGSTILQSTGSATLNLPPTEAGLTYTFINLTATNTLSISPNANDKIMGSIMDIVTGSAVIHNTNGSGVDNKDLTLDVDSKVGDRVTLVADGTNGWYITEGLGSWTFEN